MHAKHLKAFTTIGSALAAGVAHAQETPRKGGTIRMTAPYAASFGSLDPHTTPRAQDDIINKALHRTLYNWDSKDNKLVLELAPDVGGSISAFYSQAPGRAPEHWLAQVEAARDERHRARQQAGQQRQPDRRLQDPDDRWRRVR